MTVSHVAPSVAREAARYVWPLIEKAAAASAETPESLVALAENGLADFWIARDGQKPVAVGFTQILKAQKYTHVAVLAIGGDKGMRWYRDALEAVVSDAKKYGATKMTLWRTGGRKTFLGREPTGYYYEDPI